MHIEEAIEKKKQNKQQENVLICHFYSAKILKYICLESTSLNCILYQLICLKVSLF